MKKNTGKLKLQRETLGSLEENALREVAGRAKGPTAIDCSVTCLASDPTSFNCL